MPSVQVECPSCRKSTARRQISRGTGFILKGGGWYADLYSSNKPKSEGGEAKPAAKTEGAGSPTPAAAPASGGGDGGSSGGGNTGNGSSGSSSGSGSSGTGPVNSAPKVAAAKA